MAPYRRGLWDPTDRAELKGSRIRKAARGAIGVAVSLLQCWRTRAVTSSQVR